MMFGILVIHMAVLMIFNNFLKKRELIYRPVTLTVLDSETKQPLEGIKVTIVNLLFSIRPLFIPVDTISDYVYYMYEYETNDEGVVEIPQFIYKVDRYHSVRRQYIIINLESEKIKDRTYKAHWYTLVVFIEPHNLFFRPNREYKAGMISLYTITHNMNPIAREQREKTKPYITKILKHYKLPEGVKLDDATCFNCEHDEFIFYLERFNELRDTINII